MEEYDQDEVYGSQVLNYTSSSGGSHRKVRPRLAKEVSLATAGCREELHPQTELVWTLWPHCVPVCWAAQPEPSRE